MTIHYGLNNPWPTSRFYRSVTAAEIAGAEYSGAAPILTADDTIYAFANVPYRTGIQLSTRLVVAKARELGDLKPTLERSLLIDSMDGDRAWFWWLAGTDPVNQQALIRPWVGPNGERGFTHAQPGGFSFATSVLGDPQYKSDGAQPLLVDLWAESLPSSPEVSIATKLFEPGQVIYKYQPALAKGKEVWLLLRLRPSDLKDDKGAVLEDWKNVTFLRISGAAKGEQRTVIKKLRWEKPE